MTNYSNPEIARLGQPASDANEVLSGSFWGRLSPAVDALRDATLRAGGEVHGFVLVDGELRPTRPVAINAPVSPEITVAPETVAQVADLTIARASERANLLAEARNLTDRLAA